MTGPVETSAPTGPPAPVRVAQKWGFGMAPVKPATEQSRRAAASRLLSALEAGPDTAPGPEDLSEAKGLFSRAWRQDQWDWFTVWAALGRPGRARARAAADALGDLRRALVDGDGGLVREAAGRFDAAGGRHHLRAFLDGTGTATRTPGVGYLYVLSTRDAPRMLKIGYTDRDVETRVAELNAATAVPVPYGCRAVWVVRDARAVEAQVHALLAANRVRPDREFFDVEYRDAVRVINAHLREIRAER